MVKFAEVNAFNCIYALLPFIFPIPNRISISLFQNMCLRLKVVHMVVRVVIFTGKNELSVILCSASESDSELDGAPNDVLELIKQYQLSTFVAKVGHPFSSKHSCFELIFITKQLFNFQISFFFL